MHLVFLRVSSGLEITEVGGLDGFSLHLPIAKIASILYTSSSQLSHLPNPVFLFISFLTPDSQGCISPPCLNNRFYCLAKMHTSFLTSPWNKPIENTLYAPKHIIVATSESWSPACQSSLHDGLDRLHFARGGIISC